MTESKKRGWDVISEDETAQQDETSSRYMLRDSTIVESDEKIREYIQREWSKDTTQIFDDFILNSRLNDILTCRPTRNNTKSIKKLWYTTTCYLSGKIIILFFTMLRLFSVNVGIPDKTMLTRLWLIVEKMMWEIMTTNNITYSSTPPSLKMIGQENEGLGDFIRSKADGETYRKILNSLLYITSVSRGELDRCKIVDNMLVDDMSVRLTDILTNDYRIPQLDCSFVNNKIPIIAGISITTSMDRTPSGIIHWFSFVIDKEIGIIDLYSSWADGGYRVHGIQSVMTKVSVDINDFNEIIRVFNDGTSDEGVINDTIGLLTKYFFSNPPIGSEDVTTYLRSVFLTNDDSIIAGKFNIIIFPFYYSHCINVSNLILKLSLESTIVESEMSSVVKISKELYFDPNLFDLKSLLILLYTKMGCNNSGFYLEGYFGVRGGKQTKRRRTKKRKTIKRKTIKRKRRYKK
jgi:hypothetical protein